MKPIVVKGLADLEHPVGTAFEIRPITKLPPAQPRTVLDWEAEMPLARCFDVLDPAILDVLNPSPGGPSARMYALRVFPPGRRAVLNLAVDTPDRSEREAAVLLYGLLHAAPRELLLIQSGPVLHGIGLGESRGILVLQGTPEEARVLLGQLRTKVVVAANPKHAVLVMENDPPFLFPVSTEAQEFYTNMLKPRFDEFGPFALVPVDLWGDDGR